MYIFVFSNITTYNTLNKWSIDGRNCSLGQFALACLWSINHLGIFNAFWSLPELHLWKCAIQPPLKKILATPLNSSNKLFAIQHFNKKHKVGGGLKLL